MPPDPSNRRSAEAAVLPPDTAEIADALADAARAAILPFFRATDLVIESKGETGFDPVTAADRAAEQAMRRILAERRPEDGVRGEEFGDTPGRSGLTWVLDPIDGTRAFMIGAPSWGVLIALCCETGPRYGVIDQPHTGERWRGGAGTASLTTPYSTTALRTRAPRPLSEALLCTTFPEVGSQTEGAAFRRVASRVRLVRYGLDCYAYGLLAAGLIDLVIEAGLQDFDICAPMAVVESAGGVVTAWDGGPAQHGGRVIAAANAEIHAAALEALAL